jgi:DNA-binding NtrC family response regulator
MPWRSTIRVESSPGQGTSIHICFPVIPRGDEAACPQFDTAPPPGGTERILVVDDEEAVLLMEKELLESLGYTVTAFSASMEALDFFRGQGGAVDLVITDQTMPLVPGALLVRELRKIRADIPVILCTGYSSVMDANKAMDLGVQEFLMKPFDIRQLAMAVRRVLEKTHS